MKLSEKTTLEALKKIRFSGQNFDPTARWMQKWAAYAMEPEKWSKPSEKAPISKLNNKE